MTQQVITITPGGGMSGLQRKPGQGIDLRRFGRAKISRASLIEWDEAEQAWFINVTQEVGRGRVSVWDYAQTDARMPIADFVPSVRTEKYQPDGLLLFDEYEDAVKAEIAYLDALRKQGRF